MTVIALEALREDIRPAAVALRAPDIHAIAEHAARRIAPLWPLQHFVAVNPFLGLSDQHFAEAAQTLARVAGAQLTMPRAFYIEAITGGRISDADLALALQRAEDTPSRPRNVAALRRALQTTLSSVQEPLPTVADAASQATGYDWSELARERISLWAASHFDQGQAPWS
ncbi:MAG: putative inorganic carbon transporter subunit DabA, partial [Rhodanobacter sp.]